MQNDLMILILACGLVSCQSRPTVVVNEGLTDDRRFEYSSPPLWNSSMLKLKQHMNNLEPYIFNSVEFKNPEHRRFLSKEIHNLAAVSKNVKHDPAMKSKDPTVRFVADQFSKEIEEADENFSMGLTEFTRWQLMRATKYCLECHTRMNEGMVQRSAQQNPPYVKTLPPVDQMELMIAFRQFQPAFDFALTTLNSVKSLNQYQFSAERVARLGLLVAVQQMQDRTQALRFVDAIEKNPALPIYLKESNRLWKRSLEKWNDSQRLSTLASMRELSKNNISDIESMRLIPALLQFLSENPSEEEMSETLFLLGESYENLSKISFLSLPEKYYELCILKAPKSTWARKSFARLADLIKLSYSGSSGTHMPKKVRDHLDKLEEMIK